METLPQLFWQGVEQFNHGQFYACHDTLEALWIEATDPPKSFYQGILQIAVACYHLGNQNWRGAVILLGEGIKRLAPYQPEYAHIDVDQLVQMSSDLLTHLQQAGPDRVAELSQLVLSGQRVSPAAMGRSNLESEAIQLPTLVKIPASA